MKIATLICIIIFTLSMFPTAMTAQVENDYPFSIKPGTDEWKNLPSHAERVKRLQLPETVLKSMSTQDLIDACKQYPFLTEIVFYNSLQEGFENVAKDFNGLRELLNRKDAASRILKHYQKLDPEKYNVEWPQVKQGRYSFEILFVEMLLAQDEVLGSLNKDQRRQLLGESIKKMDGKMAHPNVYGLLSLNPSALVMGRIMQRENSRSFTQDFRGSQKTGIFLKKAPVMDMQLLMEMRSKADEFMASDQ